MHFLSSWSSVDTYIWLVHRRTGRLSAVCRAWPSSACCKTEELGVPTGELINEFEPTSAKAGHVE